MRVTFLSLDDLSGIPWPWEYNCSIGQSNLHISPSVSIQMDLLSTLNSVAPAPSKKLELTIKTHTIDTRELKAAPIVQIDLKKKESIPNNEYFKVEEKAENIQHFKDQYGNTHMIVKKNDPLQVFGKQKKLPINTAQPIRIDHKVVIDREEMKKWDVPPCVSNYTNPQGYVIPLDKRMASTHKKEIVMSEKFGEVAAALYEADHKMKEKLQDRRIQEQKVLKQQQQIIEHDLEELTKNKKTMAGDKHIYDEFQQEQTEQRFKRRKPAQEEPRMQYDTRLQFNSGEEPTENIQEIMNAKILYEKDDKTKKT